MKKKISLMLCVLIAALGLTACGNSEKSALEYDESTLVQASDFIIDYCSSADEATIDQVESMPEFNLQLQLTQAGLPFTPDSFLGAIDSWKAASRECGTYVSHDDYKIEADNDEVKVTANAVFEGREATITFIYDDEMYLDSVTVDADYTTGEIMKKAGLNTILGMGTVFVVLIFISILISFFKYIPVIEEKLKNRKKTTEQPETKSVQAVTEPTEAEAVEDAELVAVIAAAIAASEGTTTDGFVVRSIRRRSSNKWNS